jgi:Bifunctional DNA primase/polymerase, N-terminal
VVGPDPVQVEALRARLNKVRLRPVEMYNVAAGKRLCHGKLGKHPFGNKWQERAQLDPPATVTAPVNPDATNTGLYCGGLRALDFDIDDAAMCEQCVDLAQEIPRSGTDPLPP